MKKSTFANPLGLSKKTKLRKVGLTKKETFPTLKQHRKLR